MLNWSTYLQRLHMCTHRRYPLWEHEPQILQIEMTTMLFSLSISDWRARLATIDACSGCILHNLFVWKLIVNLHSTWQQCQTQWPLLKTIWWLPVRLNCAPHYRPTHKHPIPMCCQHRALLNQINSAPVPNLCHCHRCLAACGALTLANIPLSFSIDFVFVWRRRWCQWCRRWFYVALFWTQ